MALGAVKPCVPPETPTGKVNITDLDSRVLKVRQGYVQGYNAQAAVGEGQIAIAAEVTISSPAFGHLEPTLERLREGIAALGADSEEIDEARRLLEDPANMITAPMRCAARARHE